MTSYFKHRMRSKDPIVIIGTIIFIAILITFFVTLFGYVIMYLWNWLMPLIFGLTTITFWQAIGLGALSKLLFGGFGSDKSSKKSNKCDPKKSPKKDFSKWKHYNAYWKEEGEKAYADFINKRETPYLEKSSENQ